MVQLRVEVWSDIACPWCYVGKRRLEAALRDFPHRDQVAVVWRAFELDPTAPRERDRSVAYAVRLAKKYGSSVAEAERMIANMTEVARGEGLEFHFERVRSGNTFDAHRVLHLAGERRCQDAVKERFLRGYMTEGEPIGDPETLVRLAAEAGLDAAEVRAALAGGANAELVRADEARAGELGIRSVPFFLVRGHGVSGAQSAAVILGVLTQAWGEMGTGSPAAAAVCGPDGCS